MIHEKNIIKGSDPLLFVPEQQLSVSCSNCGGDIRCSPEDAQSSLIECKCPHCGLVDVYPESRLMANFKASRDR